VVEQPAPVEQVRKPYAAQGGYGIVGLQPPVGSSRSAVPPISATAAAAWPRVGTLDLVCIDHAGMMLGHEAVAEFVPPLHFGVP
jgi:hypothetical protein